MTKVSWQTRTAVLYDAIQSGKLPAGANGGNAYDFNAAKVLQQSFDFHVDEKAVMKKNDSYLAYWWRMSHYSANAGIIISEPTPIVFGKKNKNAKTIAMIHHINDELAGSSLKHKWFFDRLKKRLLSEDLVITVSSYWEKYLEKLGCRRIKIIYNAFDLSEFEISDQAVEAFKKENNFSSDVPIVYLGNAHKQKGVYEAYEALKEKNYQLVMTGATNYAKDLPVKFLSLDRQNYIALLRASNLVITLSRMNEGWNRIAHEALICKTPVIGSGNGGMQELLDGAGQVTVKDPALLGEKAELVMQNRQHYAERGYAYVKKFNMDYFKSEWIKTVQELTGE